LWITVEDPIFSQLRRYGNRGYTWLRAPGAQALNPARAVLEGLLGSHRYASPPKAHPALKTRLDFAFRASGRQVAGLSPVGFGRSISAWDLKQPLSLSPLWLAGGERFKFALHARLVIAACPPCAELRSSWWRRTKLPSAVDAAGQVPKSGFSLCLGFDFSGYEDGGPAAIRELGWAAGHQFHNDRPRNTSTT
jgi:hypothetical protein